MKNLITPTFLVPLLFAIQLLPAQPPSFSWNVSWGNAELDFNPSLATDEAGSIYCAGYFKGTIDFDPGPGQATLTSGSGGFGSDTYISKFDSTGQFLWVKQIGGQSTPRGILMDGDGNLHVGGEFVLAGDFDPGPGTFNLIPINSSNDVYILTLDHDGNFIDAYQIGGNGQEYFGSMTMDHEGNMLIGGQFSGTSDFDPGIGEAIFTSGTSGFSNSDQFVVKYDPNSNFIWAKEISGNIQGAIKGILVDSDNNLYFAGVFDDYRDFDPGPDSVKLTALGGWDIYVLKWNKNGQFIWVRHLGNIDGDNWAHDMVMTKGQDLLVTGHFTGTLDFNTGPGTFEMTATNTDPYIWKLDRDGNFIWSVQLAGVSFDQGRDITLDEQGNIYSTGWFGDVVDFDPGAGNYMLTSAGANDKDDGYVTKLSPDGHFIWAHSLGGIQDDYGRETKVDRFGNIFITGNFQGEASFYPSQTLDSLGSNGSWDTFLVRWKQCQQTFGEISPVACDTYTSPSGNYTWDVSGDYTDTITNISGCDSIVTIHLTITTINTTVTLVPNVGLEAEMDGAIYQWLDCDQGYAEIPEETNQFFSAVASGNYAVVISDGLCVDTSACVNVTIVATHEEDRNSGIRIYPNPTQDYWTINMGQQYNQVTVAIYDHYGRQLFYSPYQEIEFIPLSLSLCAGVYTVIVKSGQSSSVMKLVKF